MAGKTEMDGLDQKGGILTVMTTNYPEKFPDALLDRPGRFHDICEFHLPTEEVRLQMLKRWSITSEKSTHIVTGEDVTIKFHVADADLEKIAKETEGYSGAHMFELCEFAKTLKDDDDLEMKAALIKSLEKIEEQRSLIDQTQLAGSQYKPSKRECEVSEKQLIDHYNRKHASGGMFTLEEFMEGLGSKAGRVISARHLATLKTVHSDLEEMRDMDKVPRAAQAICESCITKLGGVIKAADKPMDDDEDKPKPDEEKPKSAVQPTAEEAAEVLLGSADDELLKHIHDTIETLLAIEQQNEKAREYRESTACRELIET